MKIHPNYRSKNMATAQVDGSSVTASSTRNVGGAVMHGGTTTLLDNVSLGNTNGGPTGTGPVDSTTTNKALSAGTFAYNNQSPIAKRLTETISGVSNATLQSGAAQPGLVRSIHKLEVVRTRRLTTAIRAGYWNIYSGVFSPAPTVATDTFAADDAATVSRSAPGELVFLSSGAKLDRVHDYAAKTG